VLVTDVVMPTMNGKELRTLFMSGYTANTVTHRGIVDADLFFIEKPLTREALASRIREALQG
jgi:two-component system cell cycle sensor histidine kinase/response regulator CckA